MIDHHLTTLGFLYIFCTINCLSPYSLLLQPKFMSQGFLESLSIVNTHHSHLKVLFLLHYYEQSLLSHNATALVQSVSSPTHQPPERALLLSQPFSSLPSLRNNSLWIFLVVVIYLKQKDLVYLSFSRFLYERIDFWLVCSLFLFFTFSKFIQIANYKK